MTKKAVDVVLLPPEEVIEKVIEMNKDLRKEKPDNLKLGRYDYIPHISLAMGVIDDKDHNDVEDILEELREEFSHINSKEVETGEVFSAIILENTDELQKLHETVVEKFKSVFNYKASKDVSYGSENILETTVDWVNHFNRKSAYENFEPHLKEKTEFEAKKIAVCHLGKFCTCRDILLAAELE